MCIRDRYIGWYDGLPEKCETITWQIDQDKPVVISEFGAGAKQGLHGDKHARWTEEFQEDLYIKTLAMLYRVEKIQGISPWILVDFRSPRRVLPKIQDGWNRKGLISEEGVKKKAFLSGVFGVSLAIDQMITLARFLSRLINSESWCSAFL